MWLSTRSPDGRIMGKEAKRAEGQTLAPFACEMRSERTDACKSDSSEKNLYDVSETWERNRPPVRSLRPSMHAIDHQCKGSVIMALRKKVLAQSSKCDPGHMYEVLAHSSRCMML
jgi:hypothetical protein